MPHKIDLIFTRDFCLTMSDFWDALLIKRLPEEFGKGLSQITHFTGRAAEYYRRRDELDAVKEAVFSQGLDTYLFSEVRIQQFKKDIGVLRNMIEQTTLQSIEENAERFRELQTTFSAMYPIYMLSVFLPNKWHDDFLARYGDSGKSCADRFYEARLYSEGFFEKVDTYVRTIFVAPCLERCGLPATFSHVIRLQELQDMLAGMDAPTLSVLQERAREYILFENNLVVGKDFKDFLREYDFIYEGAYTDNSLTECKGEVACQAKPVQGMVQIIMNTKEAHGFIKGNILVTSMTSPEYLGAMKQALAIVTDEGGVTCHAAIVSRELGIPCIIGTRVATKILHDGDRVEVDAEKGLVRKI